MWDGSHSQGLTPGSYRDPVFRCCSYVRYPPGTSRHLPAHPVFETQMIQAGHAARRLFSRREIGLGKAQLGWGGAEGAL